MRRVWALGIPLGSRRAKTSKFMEVACALLKSTAHFDLLWERCGDPRPWPTPIQKYKMLVDEYPRTFSLLQLQNRRR